jgi:hypothetical protein
MKKSKGIRLGLAAVLSLIVLVSAVVLMTASSGVAAGNQYQGPPSGLPNCAHHSCPAPH